MTTETQDQIILGDLHPLEYEHPLEAEAMELLQATPGLEKLSNSLFKSQVQEWVTLKCTGSNLLVTDECFSELHQSFNAVCQRIALAEVPRLYLRHGNDGGIGAECIGVEKPMIGLDASAVDILGNHELGFILGRQAGHIKSDHSLYTFMAKAVSSYKGGITEEAIKAIPFIGGASGVAIASAKTGLEMALLYWRLMSEFTADRAGLLVCQDKDKAISTLVKTARLPSKHIEDDCNEAFIKQTREFEGVDSDEWISKTFKTARPDPSINWAVLRASELLKWVESGEYDSVLSRESKWKVQTAREGGLIICRICSYRLTGTEKFCPCCGSALSIAPNISSEKKTCHACSFEIKGNEKFCPGCGENLN